MIKYVFSKRIWHYYWRYFDIWIILCMYSMSYFSDVCTWIFRLSFTANKTSISPSFRALRVFQMPMLVQKKIRMWYLDSNKDSSIVNSYLVCLHHCLSLVRWLTCKHVYPHLHYDPSTQMVSGEYEYGHFVFFRPAVKPEVRRPDGCVKCLNYQPHPVRFEMFHPMLF